MRDEKVLIFPASVCRSFDEMSTKLSQVTDVTAEIVELSNYLHICSSQTMTQLLQEIQNATDRLMFLLQVGFICRYFYVL